MRDLEKYEQEYRDNPFEEYMLGYRHMKTLEILNGYAASKILEIGCGEKPLYTYYDAFERLTIIEPAKGFYKNAADNAPANVTVINDRFDDACASTLHGDFDFILLSSLLHEVVDPKAMLDAVRTICTKDTILHVNVPNAKSLHRLLALRMNIIETLHQKSSRQVRYQQSTTFDIEGLVQLMRATRFAVIDTGTFFVKPFTHRQMQDLLDKEILDSRMLDGLYALSQDLPELGAEIYLNARIDT